MEAFNLNALGHAERFDKLNDLLRSANYSDDFIRHRFGLERAEDFDKRSGALMADGRRTLADISRAVNNFDRNPSRVLFGGGNNAAQPPEATATTSPTAVVRDRRSLLAAALVAVPPIMWGSWPLVLRTAALAPAASALIGMLVQAVPAPLLAWLDAAIKAAGL